MKPEIKIAFILSLLFCLYATLCSFFLHINTVLLIGVSSVAVFLISYWLLSKYFFEKKKNSGIRLEWVKIIKSEANYKTLINRISDGFLSLDKDLHFTYANDRILEMTGKNWEEIINKPIGEVFPQALDSDTYRMINLAFSEQRYISNTDYYEPLNLWQENHIYPSGDGVSLFIRDISEKKRATLEVEKSEKRFRALIENSEDIISLMNAEGKIIYVSPAFERVSGFSSAEIVGRFLFDFMPSENVTRADQKLKALLNSPGLLIHSSNQLLTKKGDFVLIEGTVLNLLEDQNVGAIVCNFRDITERKKNEAHIQESEALYRDLFTNMMHGFMYGKVIVENGRVTDYTYIAVNEEYKRLTGIENPAGKNVSQTIPDFARSNPGFFDALSMVTIGGKQVHLELYVEQFKRWYSTTLYSPKEGYFVSLFDDITVKKKLEEQQSLFASIVTSSQDAIFSRNEEGLITSWNHSAEKLFGYSTSEAIGMNFRRFIPAHSPETQDETLEKTDDDIRVKHFETQRVRKNGELFSVSLTISPILDDKGQRKGASVIARDITEKKAAEEQIKYSENNLHTIFENSSEAFVLTDKNLVVKAFNTKSRESLLFQFGAGHIEQGSYFPELISPSRQEELKSIFDKVLRGETIQMEGNSKKPDGQPIWYHAAFNPVREKDVITGICIAWRDITNRKKNEEQLIHSEENLRAIFKTTTQGFILIDTAGTVKSFNDNAFKYGCSAYGNKMYTGQNLYEFIGENRVGFLKEVVEKVAQGETIEYSRSYKIGNQDRLWLDFTFSPVKHGDTVTAICITGNDITDKKRIEKEREFDRSNLESLINNTGDLMWSVDRNMRIITFNKPFEEMIRKFSGVTTVKGMSALNPDFDQKTLSYYQKNYQRAFTGESFTEIIYYEQSNDWLETSFYPIFEGESVVGTACFSKNITERKKYEEQLAKNSQEKEAFITELSQNNKDLQQFAYITSHNLRGPIASLLGLSNLLSNFTIKDQTLAQILEGIKKSTLRFDETIKDLNTILTVRDTPSVQREDLLFRNAFQKTLELCDSLVRDSNAVITFDFEAASGIYFNKSYLESIFLNLLTNALKYRDHVRQLKIHIQTERIQNVTVMTFTDNGIGMNLALHKDKIFKLYQRFHHNREGKGLGLFLIKSQLEALNGSIHIKSELDKGTEFTIHFKDN